MNILVTGVAGFIGCNFVHYYLETYKNRTLIGLDKLTYAGNMENLSCLNNAQKKRFVFIKGDINNKGLVRKIFKDYNIDGIINFAAESHVDRSIHSSHLFIKTNVLGVQTLLDVAKENWYINNCWASGKKFLQVSTDEVYGSLGPKGFFTESTPLDPHSPYSASKAAADLLVKAYHDTYKMPINITRCSNNYGPYQFPEKLISLIITNCLEHKHLPVYGDGRQIRDWLFVRDHCKAIDNVLENGMSGETYNIGGNNEKMNIEIFRMIIKILREKTKDEKINDNLIKHIRDRPGHDRRYAIDSSKISKELGWAPKTNFIEGIDATLEWYLKNYKWIKNVQTEEYREFYDKNYGT